MVDASNMVIVSKMMIKITITITQISSIIMTTTMTYIYIYSQAQLEHFVKNLQYLREAHKNLSDCGKDTAVL